MRHFLNALLLVGLGTSSAQRGPSQGGTSLLSKITLAESNCEFSPLVSTPLLFVNYKLENNSAESVFDLELHYEIDYSVADQPLPVKKNGTGTVERLLSRLPKSDRVLVAELSGKRTDYRITSCKVWIGGFFREVVVTRNRTVTVNTGETVKVAPDCKDDYAKLQAMKPGVEKREFAARLIRAGCVSSEPTYGKKTEAYKANEYVWVEYQ